MKGADINRWSHIVESSCFLDTLSKLLGNEAVPDAVLASWFPATNGSSLGERTTTCSDLDDDIGKVIDALSPIHDFAHFISELGLKDVRPAVPLLQLAALIDGLDSELQETQWSVALEVRRRLIHQCCSPFAYADRLLAGMQRCDAWLGQPGPVALARRVAQCLVEHSAGSDEDLCKDLESKLAQCLRKLQMGVLVTVEDAQSPKSHFLRSVKRAVDLGWSALDLSERCSSAWEVQRSNFLGREELVGDLFTPLVVVDFVSQTGRDVESLLREVNEARVSDGIRYYRECHEMPYDIDDAAAMIIAVHCAPGVVAESLVETARRVIEHASCDGGCLSTWVVLDDNRVEPPPEKWFGNTCVGAAARALRAAAIDDIWSRSRLRETMKWFLSLRDDDGGFTSVHYPSRVATTSLAVEALVKLEKRLGQEVGEVVDETAQWLERQQNPSGGIGENALETAMAVLALHSARKLSEYSAADAAAFLIKSQRWDGRWPDAPFFLCPYPTGQMGRFGRSAITTAAALTALNVIEAMLGSS